MRKIMAAFTLLVLASIPAAAQSVPAPATPPPAATQVVPNPPEPNYILGAEDVVQVDALGRADFSTKTKIGTDGTIQLPLLGTVKASNRSPAQLRDEIAAALQKGGFFAKPIVNVEVVSYASRYVTVLGDVTSPGLIPVDRPYRLSEILARVGGVREGGADYIVIRSIGGPERDLQIKDLATGDEKTDPYVNPGDKIYSPKADIFYVQGQVKAPGSYQMTPDMTLAMALARGGGLTDLGSVSYIKITRKNNTFEPKDLNVNVEPNDVIDVGQGWL